MSFDCGNSTRRDRRRWRRTSPASSTSSSLGPVVGLREVEAGGWRAHYLARFGHRGVNETELAWPRPSEDPNWLDRTLAELDDVTAVADLRRRQQQAYDATLARIEAADPRAAKRVARQLHRAARHAALREAVRSEGVRTTGVARRFALKAGELLGIGGDVFMLTVDELLAALGGDATAYTHFPARREAHRRYRELPPLPGVIVGRFDPIAWAADPHRNPALFVAGAGDGPRPSPSSLLDDGVIIGHAGAAGRVEGTVRQLKRYSDAGELKPGEILVTQLTNIGWTPLFPRAAAIVTDLGAPLSHAAIVARELGIPAVVGCGDATVRLRTGDRVQVDGAAGRVTVCALHQHAATAELFPSRSVGVPPARRRGRGRIREAPLASRHRRTPVAQGTLAQLASGRSAADTGSVGSDEPDDGGSVPHHHQCRDAARVEPCRDVRVVVDVDLHHLHSPGVLNRQPLQNRRHRAAGAAPGRPQIDQDDVIRLGRAVEVVIHGVHEPGQRLVAGRALGTSLRRNGDSVLGAARRARGYT